MNLCAVEKKNSKEKKEQQEEEAKPDSYKEVAVKEEEKI